MYYSKKEGKGNNGIRGHTFDYVYVINQRDVRGIGKLIEETRDEQIG